MMVLLSVGTVKPMIDPVVTVPTVVTGPTVMAAPTVVTVAAPEGEGCRADGLC